MGHKRTQWGHILFAWIVLAAASGAIIHVTFALVAMCRARHVLHEFRWEVAVMVWAGRVGAVGGFWAGAKDAWAYYSRPRHLATSVRNAPTDHRAR